VNTYLGLWSRIHYMDTWYTMPVDPNRPLKASQNWHRDPEDVKQIKAFLYLVDVDESTGPFQYIPGSRRTGGPYHHLWRRRSQAYPPAKELEARIPPSKWLTCTGPAGLFILCDTTGIHRGGFATRNARLFSTWTWVTPAAFLKRRFSLAPGMAPDPLSDAARRGLLG